MNPRQHSGQRQLLRGGVIVLGHPRQSGTALVMVVCFIILLLGLAAGMTMTSMAGARATVVSDADMRAFYIADSGAQIAIANLRATGGTSGDGTFAEAIGGGDVAVETVQLSPGLYQITSTGAYADHRRVVETCVALRGTRGLPGALTVMFSPGVIMRARNVATALLGTANLNGMDHSPTGDLLADQSRAVPGFAINPIPGGGGFGVTYGHIDGSILGMPEPIDDSATDISAALVSLRDHARENAHIILTGSRTLTTADTGAFGALADPKIVYARLEDGQTLSLEQTFQGYGTLVVETNSALSASVLAMRDLAAWNGAVIVYISGSAESKGHALVRTQDSAKIIGGLAIFLNAEEAEIQGVGKFYHGSPGSGVLYSSQMVSTARGLQPGQEITVISYRLP